jgi:hypothetical protein
MDRRSIKSLVTIMFVISLLSGCGRSAPTPLPATPTPVPGYVGGEEAAAYASFIEFYSEEIIDCTWMEYPSVYSVSTKEYQGKAIYVGDGIWRFYIQVSIVDLKDRSYEPTYREEVVDWRSKPDRTWEDKCNRDRNPRQDEEYYPDHPDEDIEPPPDQDWP